MGLKTYIKDTDKDIQECKNLTPKAQIGECVLKLDPHVTITVDIFTFPLNSTFSNPKISSTNPFIRFLLPSPDL